MSDNPAVDEPKSPLRDPLSFYAVVAAAVSVLAFLFVNLKAGERLNPFVERRPFAGCYFAQNADPFALTEDGRVLMGSTVVGSYAIRGPVGGKHGHLLELSGTGFAEEQNKMTLRPEGLAQRLDIQPSGIISVYEGGAELKYRRGRCRGA